jgi:hypothetical protein
VSRQRGGATSRTELALPLLRGVVELLAGAARRGPLLPRRLDGPRYGWFGERLIARLRSLDLRELRGEDIAEFVTGYGRNKARNLFVVR